MKEIILLVTWFVGGQTPEESYQVSFTSREACEAAVVALKQEAAAMDSAGREYVDERLA